MKFTSALLLGTLAVSTSLGVAPALAQVYNYKTYDKFRTGKHVNLAEPDQIIAKFVAALGQTPEEFSDEYPLYQQVTEPRSILYRGERTNNDGSKTPMVVLALYQQAVPLAVQALAQSEFSVAPEVFDDYPDGMIILIRAKGDKFRGSFSVYKNTTDAAGNKPPLTVSVRDKLDVEFPAGTEVFDQQKMQGGKLETYNLIVPGNIGTVTQGLIAQFDKSNFQFRDTQTDDGNSIRFEDDNTRGTFVISPEGLKEGTVNVVISINYR